MKSKCAQRFLKTWEINSFLKSAKDNIHEFQAFFPDGFVKRELQPFD